MYRTIELPQPLRAEFASLAWWTPQESAGSLLLPADPGFEIAWSDEGRAWLTPANRRCRVVPGGNAAMTFLRLRPEAVGGWLGSDAMAMVDGPSVPLDALGTRWRRVARAGSEVERLRALTEIPRGAPDPVVRRSLARLSAARPPTFASLAADEGYSYEQWLRRMKAATGVSPRFLAGYRSLQRAVSLARSHPTMGMAEVAFRAGFADDAALASATRRLSGRTFRALAANFTLPE